MQRPRLLPVLVSLALAALACTDVTLYSTTGGEKPALDRVSLRGALCAQLPDASSFPVKTLLLVDGSSAVRSAGPDAVSQTLESAKTLFESSTWRRARIHPA